MKESFGTFPLLVVVVSLGRISCLQKLTIIIAIKSCLLSFHRLAPSRLWRSTA
jgi:hypothetical protein